MNDYNDYIAITCSTIVIEYLKMIQPYGAQNRRYIPAISLL